MFSFCCGMYGVWCSSEAIAKLWGVSVRSIAEGLVLGSATTAQRHAVAEFVGVSIGTGERDASADPQGTTTSPDRIFDNSDRLRQSRLEGLTGFFVKSDQSASRAHAYLLNELRTHIGIIGLTDLVPDTVVGIAKSSGRAQILCVSQLHSWAVE